MSERTGSPASVLPASRTAVSVRVRAHLPCPGAAAQPMTRTLEVLDADRCRLVLPEAIIIDAGGLPGLDAVASADPAWGGGPLAAPDDRERAVAYGVGNTAWHVQRGLRYCASLLGRALPVLTVRLRAHGPDWGGGHYRLPAARYSELAEQPGIASSGEVHLGSGCRYVTTSGGRYFAGPSHNAAIIYHELGHHLCRHTADFRGNRHRGLEAQTNLRTAVEEGTCDYLAATLLGHPDIYGWHRGDRADHDPRRRRLDTPVTMAAFRGGRDIDPHTDGTVWATALWSGRQAWQQVGLESESFDAALIRGLACLGSEDLGDDPAERAEGLRRRRYFSVALASLLEQAGDDHGATAVERAFAARGISVGRSNAELREAARR